MIPFDFEYYKPSTINEAIETFNKLKQDKKSPVYYGGGSELISMARVGNILFGSVIDIKDIPECRVLKSENNNLILGSALTLTEICESKLFPLLGKTGGRIADHTMQCKITLGGNIASTIIYRETVLPLFLADAKLTVAGKYGLKEKNISDVFCGRLNLRQGEFIINAVISEDYVKLPYVHVKKTKNEKIDYPLFTMAALKKNGFVRVAFSGLASCPFRDTVIENILNDSNLSFNKRTDMINEKLEGLYLNDLSGSAAYRKFVLKNTLENLLKSFKD